MKRFSNTANKRLAFQHGATLLSYDHNGQRLFNTEAKRLWAEGKTVYYENQRPTKDHPNGSSHLYQVNTPKI